MNNLKRVVTASQMKQIEKNAAERGLSYYEMMENAGTQALNFIKSRETLKNKKILIFCGKGNNGGDGFVVARQAFQYSSHVKVLLVDGEPLTEDAVKNYELIKKLKIEITNIEEENENSLSLDEADIIVDAIYGTGFHGILRENARKAAKLINRSKAKVYALDIPSGVNGDTGEVDLEAVYADYTIAFDSCKPAHVMKELAFHLGETVCVDIGINESCYEFLNK
ncbi:NAD(P)H-hydrate epimerase [Anaerovorax odorimutans]|uniref:NAD(P)H-hydrate epimerase n=1 Tax=Anaerovorax odorimutans TaxID=109327 RepID=UPI00040F2193|nr:NAD(P)H-hydrate epimerase [Anaerovorax odorimutans]